MNQNINIDNLDQKGLVDLKQKIEEALNIIKIKETTPKKGTILSLKKGDKIFGIRFGLGGHTLKEPENIDGAVDIIDYCYIKEMELRGENSDSFRISMSHPTKPFGISTTLLKKDYKFEHCYLDMDLMRSGYDGFYTLKPENWKYDLIRIFNKQIEDRKKYFQKDLDILNDKLQLLINFEDEINRYI